MKRRLAKLTAPREFAFFEEEIPDPGDDEILVEVRAVGLCHSDLPPYFGTGATVINHNGYHVMAPTPYPFPLGHEPLGTVLAVGGKVRRFRPGDAIGGMWAGSFASHLLVTEPGMVKVSSDPGRLPLAEPLMCIANIARIARPEFGDRVAVIGCGYMGLLVIQALAGSHLETLAAVDLADDRLETARRFGADLTINPARENLEDAAFAATGGRMFDVVVEISGSLRGFDGALSIVRLADRIGPKGRGRLVLPSVYAKEEKWSLASGWNLMLRSPDIAVAHPRHAVDLQDTMERAVIMYDRGRLRPDELISHRFSFAELKKGFEMMASGDPSYVKGVVTF